MKVAAVVILYNPPKDVVNNIRSYAGFVDKVYAIDNSSTATESVVTLSSIDKQVRYLADKENKGIAARLNQAALLAIEAGFDWLLTMDQDSAFEDNNFSRYMACVEGYQERDRVALFGVQHKASELQSDHCNAMAVQHLITSGSLLNLHLYKQIGPFDEALYIDQVDFDFCFRALQHQFLVIQFENIFLTHSIGNISVHHSFKNLKKTNRSLHSPMRMYYMVRNYFYMKRKYKGEFEDVVQMTKNDLLNRMKNNILYSADRLTVMKYIMLGYLHFRRKRMGKL